MPRKGRAVCGVWRRSNEEARRARQNMAALREFILNEVADRRTDVRDAHVLA